MALVGCCYGAPAAGEDDPLSEPGEMAHHLLQNWADMKGRLPILQENLLVESEPTKGKDPVDR